MSYKTHSITFNDDMIGHLKLFLLSLGVFILRETI
jgi:hypothetical protein